MKGSLTPVFVAAAAEAYSGKENVARGFAR